MLDLILTTAKKNYILFFEHSFFTKCASVEWIERGPKVMEKFSF
jgi:hypothetical protein